MKRQSKLFDVDAFLKRYAEHLAARRGESKKFVPPVTPQNDNSQKTSLT